MGWTVEFGKTPMIWLVRFHVIQDGCVIAEGVNVVNNVHWQYCSISLVFIIFTYYFLAQTFTGIISASMLTGSVYVTALDFLLTLAQQSVLLKTDLTLLLAASLRCWTDWFPIRWRSSRITGVSGYDTSPSTAEAMASFLKNGPWRLKVTRPNGQTSARAPDSYL